MRYHNLQNKYNRAVNYFNNGEYYTAEKIFRSIVFDIGTSDTESMLDIHLHNNAEKYLCILKDMKYSKKKKNPLKIIFYIFLIVFFIFILFYDKLK